MTFKIDWEKVVTQTVTVVVVAVFMGAVTIVWKGATTVDGKVSQTREEMQHLVDSLSDKLATLQVQLTALSNQIVLLETFGPLPEPVSSERREALQKLQQTSLKQDILMDLKAAK